MSALPNAMSETSTKTWNGRVQSGGWTTDACESMIFSASYALSCVSVHRNGVQCTTASKGVAKSARCHSMRQWQRSWPKNCPNAFAFFGVGDFLIASIFLGSTAMPSFLTMCPNRVPLVTPNAHLAGFRLSLAMRHRSKHKQRWCKWPLGVPCTAKSSRNTCINAGMYSPNTSEMIHWNMSYYSARTRGTKAGPQGS